jgi:hypothetical protein
MRPLLNMAAAPALLRNSWREEIFQLTLIAGAEALIHFRAFSAWLKPCPYYKTRLLSGFETTSGAMYLLQIVDAARFRDYL